MTTLCETPHKLNIGAGRVEIEGFEPVDRRVGKEAYPLDYAEGSIDEIRASHILEHFPEAISERVLRDWVRVLKPGAKIRIAVPDFDKIAHDPAIAQHPHRFAYLMGGQTDENDYHKSVWTESKLRALMDRCGLVNVKRWESSNTDCAALPVSLNLEGEKGEAQEIKICAYMSVPRYGSLAARGIMESALRPFNIPLNTTQGVFWGQHMQREGFERAVADGVDWLLTLDYDSVFTTEQLDKLIGTFGSLPDIDALAALQCRRDKNTPLCTVGHSEGIETDGTPFLVTTAHFGLTLIRVSELADVAKPWFNSEPDADGQWGDDRMDDDIWFWHQWRLAGKNVWVDPSVRIGHVEECVSYFDESMEPQRCSVPQWRERFLCTST